MKRKMKDAFSNFTVAEVTSNEQVKTEANVLVDRWFYTYGIPYRIHSNWGKLFRQSDNTSPMHHVWGQTI